MRRRVSRGRGARGCSSRVRQGAELLGGSVADYAAEAGGWA
eukprot:CAMPEP_0202408382 /NCGR_PEP_ID=MMETSP1128-20130828/14673_1 /ASSEMBLY_ACC=CAM_ASM_000463 /TAXON_ID=3047 /ORGANISM="Dunaliella tertiolecta, Strain CCMP1320" /LENGTH=40 /DNA_ID= /DNA_START= /DNA_END= /DNA_ORIENTATION=